MNKEQFIELIRNPESIGNIHLNELSNLAKKYPWCQPVHMLYTKGLHNEKSIFYLDSLKQTSALTADRKILYTFIMKQALIEKIEALDQEIEKEFLEEKNVAEALTAIESERHEIQNEVKEVSALKKEPQVSEKKPSVIASVPYDDPYKEIHEEHSSNAVVVITKDILEDLIGQKIKEALPIQEDKNTSLTKVKKQLQGQENKESETILSGEGKEIEKTENPVEFTPVEKIADQYSELEKEFLWQAVNATIQVDVMNELEKLPELEVENPIPNPELTKLKAVKPEEEKTEVNQDDFNWERPHSFINWLLPKKEESKLPSEELGKEPEKSLPIEDLVDRFLKTDPRITPQKAEFYSPGNVAKLSIADNEEFVSETLAGIYEKQGYFAKAIRVYEKLSLKIPGKSAYFASRIKELEALKNNKNK